MHVDIKKDIYFFAITHNSNATFRLLKCPNVGWSWSHIRLSQMFTGWNPATQVKTLLNVPYFWSKLQWARWSLRIQTPPLYRVDPYTLKRRGGKSAFHSTQASLVKVWRVLCNKCQCVHRVPQGYIKYLGSSVSLCAPVSPIFHCF